MKNFTKTAFTALTALATIAPNAEAASNGHHHAQLMAATERAGVKIYINHKICDQRNVLGMYIPAHKAVVICQENRTPGSDRQVRWTEEDFDTLRHEVHHVVQDCRDGFMDGELESIYKRPVELGYDVLGHEYTNWIAESYGENGASGHIQVMEIEAFAVAAMNDPMDQISDLNRFCF